jgi:hypothetical protein
MFFTAKKLIHYPSCALRYLIWDQNDSDKNLPNTGSSDSGSAASRGRDLLDNAR